MFRQCNIQYRSNSTRHFLMLLFLPHQIATMLCLWWVHSMKHWSCEVCVIIPLTLRPLCLGRNAASLRGENLQNTDTPVWTYQFLITTLTSFVVTIHYTCVFKFVSLIGSYTLSYSAVFTWTNLLVVVVELSGSEQEALDLVPLVTNVVLKEHHLIVGVVVIVDSGVIPINSRGEKQRMHLRDSFLADQLDPIYVAYNMWVWTNARKAQHGTQRTTHNKPFLCAVSTQHGGRSWLVLFLPLRWALYIFLCSF